MLVVHDQPKNRKVLHIINEAELGFKYGRVLGFKIDENDKKFEWFNKGERIRLVDYHTNLEPIEGKALNQLFLRGTAFNKENGMWYIIADRLVPCDYLSILWNRYTGYVFEYNFGGKKTKVKRLWGVRFDVSQRSHYILLRSIYSNENAMFREVGK